MSSGLRMAAAVVLASLAALAGYAFFITHEETVRLPPVADCALHLESCLAKLPPGGRIRLDIEPKNPSPSDLLRVVAKFEGLQPEAVGLRFKGIDMDMGYLEYFVHELGTTRSDESGSSFSGPAGVFACSMSLMRWQVWLQIDLDGSRYEIPFAFETRQKG